MKKNFLSSEANYSVQNENQQLVAILTEEQAISLFGQPFDIWGSMFYPVQDFYDRWVISEVEVVYNTNPSFPWVNGLELVEWVPKIEVPWW